MAALLDRPLCRLCRERQGRAVSELKTPAGTRCYICEGLMDDIEKTAAKVVAKVRRYEFGTFSVGLSMPEGVQEREDEYRSNLKLKGNETVRVQAARLIAAQVAEALGKRIDRGRPDLTAVVDLSSGGVSVSSKSVYFYARYTKPRGVPQKRGFCDACSGRGCDKCRGTGFDLAPSVEGQLRRRLEAACGTDRMKFTWLGSEDRESRVNPPGRPFVAELKSPVKRSVPRRFSLRTGRGLVRVSRGKALPSKPTRLPSFTFKTLIKAEAASAPMDEDMAAFGRVFRQAEVRFDRPHEKPTSKMVHSARVRRRGRSISVEAVLDGGLPVKRFVSGELVSPSVSEVLKTEVRCRTFDILEVKETGEFGFGKISWV